MHATEMLEVFLGVTLRFAIPLGLTAALAWVLHRFDERWQTQSLREGLAKLAGPDRSIASVRCWEANDCPPERRDACCAYLEPETACWDAVSPNGHLQEACRRCALRAVKLAAAA